MYALRQALRAVRKNWIASISTLTTMTLSLTILAGFSLLVLILMLRPYGLFGTHEIERL